MADTQLQPRLVDKLILEEFGGCPSCKNKLRHGISTDKGHTTHVVWCHRAECDGCRGDGLNLLAAIKDLENNYEQRQPRRH